MESSNFIFLRHHFFFFFLHEFNLPLLLQGICIPVAHDTNQIPTSVQKLETKKCSQARNISSGKLFSIFFFFFVGILVCHNENNILENFNFSHLINSNCLILY